MNRMMACGGSDTAAISRHARDDRRAGELSEEYKRSAVDTDLEETRCLRL
jgi:hypothetical protein